MAPNTAVGRHFLSKGRSNPPIMPAYNRADLLHGVESHFISGWREQMLAYLPPQSRMQVCSGYFAFVTGCLI
jgi:hypothetical protein